MFNRKKNHRYNRRYNKSAPRETKRNFENIAINQSNAYPTHRYTTRTPQNQYDNSQIGSTQYPYSPDNNSVSPAKQFYPSSPYDYYSPQNQYDDGRIGSARYSYSPDNNFVSPREEFSEPFPNSFYNNLDDNLPSPVHYSPDDFFPIPVRTTTDVPVTTGPINIFKGPDVNNYFDLLNYIRTTKINGDFYTLGNISNDAKYYFEETNETNACANLFLSNFWANKKNDDLTVENHHEKYTRLNKNEAIFPSCISFVNATIDDKAYCFIAISDIKMLSDALKKELKIFIEDYNKKSTGSPEFVLLDGFIWNINTLINFISNNNEKYQSSKACSEKYFISLLLKLYLDYGAHLEVTGVGNYRFYPYHKNIYYGGNRKSPDSAVKPPVKNAPRLWLKDGKYTSSIPCCVACQNNKQAVLTLLKAAQEAGQDFLNEKNIVSNNRKSVKKYCTSPLRDSIATSTSLLLFDKPKEFYTTKKRKFDEENAETLKRVRVRT